MVRYKFTLEGDYVNFYQFSELKCRLNKSSQCIEWKYNDTDATLIDFYVSNILYPNAKITEIEINGNVLSAQSDFETYIKTIFTGYASGSSFDSSGFTMVTSDGTSANITLTKDGNGNLQLTITEI